MRGFPFLFLLIGLFMNPNFRTNPGPNQSYYQWPPANWPSGPLSQLHCSPTLRVPVHTEHSEREQLHHPRQEPDRTLVQGREFRHPQLCIQPVSMWYCVPWIYDRYTFLLPLISEKTVKISQLLFQYLISCRKHFFTYFDKDSFIFISCCIITPYILSRFVSNLRIFHNLQV